MGGEGGEVSFSSLQNETTLQVAACHGVQTWLHTLALRTELASSFSQKGSGVPLAPFQHGWHLPGAVFMVLVVGWDPKATSVFRCSGTEHGKYRLILCVRLRSGLLGLLICGSQSVSGGVFYLVAITAVLGFGGGVCCCSLDIS